MVDVEHGSLSALEKDPLVGPLGLIQAAPDRGRIGQDLERHLGQLRDQFVPVEGLLAEALEQRIMVQQQGIDPAGQVLGIG